MKVKEVIEALSKLDPEMLVVGRGYEGGWDDVVVHIENIYDRQGPGEKTEWWDGRYSYGDNEPTRAFDAVVIS